MSAVARPVTAGAEITSPLADVTGLPWSPEPHRIVAGSYGPRDATVRSTLAAADVVAVCLAFAFVLGPDAGWTAVAWSLSTLPGWVLLFKAYGLYEGDIKRFTSGVLHDLPSTIHAALVGTVLLRACASVIPLPLDDLGDLLGFATVTVTAALLLRIGARRALYRVQGPERAVILGDSASIPLLARKLRAHREYGVELAGVVASADANLGELPRLAHPAGLDLAALAAQHRIDRVIIAGPEALEGTLCELVRAGHRLGLKVDYLPHPLEVLGTAVEVDDIEGVTVFGLYPPVLCRSSRYVKRAMDVVGALPLLLLSAPLMVLIAIAVKLDSPGPALFRHERIGRGGRRFRIAKFRTMVVGADAMTEQLRAGSRDPHWLLLDRDPRVTRVGRLLRCSSLDELPQLWSVLRGDMSLVGPRPLVEAEDRQITGWDRGRLDLTPGLTGLWQVLGRTSIPFDEMVKLDYAYVTSWSVWGDVQLLLRTVPVLLTRRGAN
jgi:exopolysaccharide biosynthesis polyprenyl glycosylphosphotransferase